jgi:hypothetical protein
MISMLAVALGRVFQLPFLQGYRTTIAAIGLIGLCLYLVSVGQYESGLANLFFALGLLGIRFRWTPPAPTIPPVNPPGPPSPASEPPINELFDQADLLDQVMDFDRPPVMVFQASPQELERQGRRRIRRQAAIAELVKRGVSRFDIAIWLPVILALLEHLPEIIDTVNRIIDAIRKRRKPAEVLAEVGRPFPF